VAALVAATALTGCGSLLRNKVEYESTEPVKITEIAISGGSGDVIVRPGAASSVDIHRTLLYRGKRVPDEKTYTVDGTVLRIDTVCDVSDCGVNYAIRAPEGVRITGENGSGNLRVDGVSTMDLQIGSGDVVIRGATGAIRVRTGSGNIDLVDLRGTADVRTSSGDIEGLELNSGTVTARTGSGNIRLDMMQPAEINATTGSGDLRLAMPSGDYRVQAETGSGRQEIRIAHTPTGRHLLNLRTGSGNITVNPR
jgi:DUF4097 and DUF4098 domain-containing protein YvlB